MEETFTPECHEIASPPWNSVWSDARIKPKAVSQRTAHGSNHQRAACLTLWDLIVYFPFLFLIMFLCPWTRVEEFIWMLPKWETSMSPFISQREKKTLIILSHLKGCRRFQISRPRNVRLSWDKFFSFNIFFNISISISTECEIFLFLRRFKGLLWRWEWK